MAVHKAADPSLYGMKAAVLKLGGFAKFELDHKLNATQFYNLIIKLSTTIVEGEAQVNHELCDRLCATFKKAWENGEPFKGDLNSELYLSILAGFRSWDPNSE